MHPLLVPNTKSRFPSFVIAGDMKQAKLTAGEFDLPVLLPSGHLCLSYCEPRDLFWDEFDQSIIMHIGLIYCFWGR
jgi:hypothetical protein